MGVFVGWACIGAAVILAILSIRYSGGGGDDFLFMLLSMGLFFLATLTLRTQDRPRS